MLLQLAGAGVAGASTLVCTITKTMGTRVFALQAVAASWGLGLGPPGWADAEPVNTNCAIRTGGTFNMGTAMTQSSCTTTTT